MRNDDDDARRYHRWEHGNVALNEIKMKSSTAERHQAMPAGWNEASWRPFQGRGVNGRGRHPDVSHHIFGPPTSS